jgi:surfeit locus 1 family protein
MAHVTFVQGGFRKIIPALAAIVVIGVTLRLGIWQLDRARERDLAEARLRAAQAAAPIDLTALPDTFPVDAWEDRPAKVEGKWMPERMILLDNRIYRDQFGYEVLMPLRLADGKRAILVDRGWIKGSGERRRPPMVQTPDGVQHIVGLIRRRTPRVGSVGKGAHEGMIWSEVTPEQFSSVSGLSIQPLILYQTSAAADGLIRDWPHPGSGSARNRGYALQWFALAAMTLVFWGYHAFRGRQHQAEKQ